ncbi:MAG TPA: hypothetical protein VLL52_21095 [Anaerolineae bacterium]|nr:hypothetical protein [Anaerolineae bacterium]
MNKKLLIPFITLLTLTSIIIASAQTGGTFDLSWSTIDGGGGTSTSGNFTLSGTIGQPDAGTMSGGNFSLNGGFWQPATSCAAPTTVTAAITTPNITFSWPSGSYNVYRAVDDPYFTTGTQIGANVSSGWTYAEPLLGNATQNGYYIIGTTTACAVRFGQFDYDLTVGS